MRINISLINIDGIGQSNEILEFTQNMTVDQAIAQLRHRGVNFPRNIKVLFGGRRLQPHDTLRNINRGTTLHVVLDGGNNQAGGRGAGAGAGVGAAAAAAAAAAGRGDAVLVRLSFNVYCSVCKSIEPARLRVRCKTCGSEAVEALIRDNCNNAEELISNNHQVHCQAACRGTIQPADIFFRCSGANHPANSESVCTLLSNVITAMPGDEECTCLSCMDDECERYVAYECGHQLCLACWNMYLSTAAGDIQRLQYDGEHGLTVSCPNYPQCTQRTIYTSNFKLFHCIPQDLYDRLQNFGVILMLKNCGGHICPLPSCNEGFIIENPAPGHRVDCPRCRRAFCTVCNSAWHEGPCEDALVAANENPQVAAIEIRQDVADRQQLRELQRGVVDERVAVGDESIRALQAEIEQATRQNIRMTTQKCPNCRTNIFKDGGCNHVTCTCGHEFCWVDLKPWGEECQSAHWFPPRRTRNRRHG